MAGSSTDVITIQISRVAQLFTTLDPSPFRERDLDPDAESYISEWADELPKGEPIRIVVQMPADEAGTPDAAALGDAIRRNFARQEAQVRRELALLFRYGRHTLLFSLLVLAVCLGATQVLADVLGERPFGAFLKEGLVIVGWVALWRPLEIFLYDWWPLLQRRRLCHRLSLAELTIRPS